MMPRKEFRDRIRCFWIIAGAALALPAFAVAQKSTDEPPQSLARAAARAHEVVAHVADATISVDEYRAELERRAGDTPGLGATPEERRRVLDEMIRHRALVARARAAGYHEDPEIVAVYERMMAARYLREHLERRLAGIAVSDEEVEAHYRAHADAYAIPPRSRGAIVFLAVHPKATAARRDEVETRATTALAEALRLDPEIRHFGDVARRYSQDRASRYAGGVIGWLDEAPGRSHPLPPEVTAALFALDEPGEIAPLTRTADGLYLVRLVDRQAGRHQPLERVADGIRHRLLTNRLQEMRRAFFKELYDELEVEIDEALLESVEMPAEARPPAFPALDSTADVARTADP